MIAPIRPVIDPIQSVGESRAAASAGDPFREVFGEAVARVKSFQEKSAASTERFLNGESEEVHQVALDAQRAEIAFDFFLQTRNKVVQAYQEIMRMPL